MARIRARRSGLKALVDIGVAQLPVAGDVSAEVTTELVGAGNVDDQMSANVCRKWVRGLFFGVCFLVN